MFGQPHTPALPQLLMRLPVPWVYVLTYLAGLGLEFLLKPSRSWMDRLPVSFVGMVLFALGAALAGWGWWIFQRAGTTRVPGQASTTMVTWGPYRFTRNPMYLGLAIAYLGEAGILHQAWPVVLLPLTILYVNRYVIPLEEAKLHEVFGEDYERYRERVCRWL